MKRLLGILLLVSVFTVASLAQEGGGTHETGGGAQPTPTPCPTGEVCGEGGGNSSAAAGGELVVTIVDGAVFIYSLLP